MLFDHIDVYIGLRLSKRWNFRWEAPRPSTLSYMTSITFNGSGISDIFQDIDFVLIIAKDCPRLLRLTYEINLSTLMLSTNDEMGELVLAFRDLTKSCKEFDELRFYWSKYKWAGTSFEKVTESLGVDKWECVVLWAWIFLTKAIARRGLRDEEEW